MVARTSLRTKLTEKIADQLTDIVTDAVLAIHKDNEPIDLYMVCGAGFLCAAAHNGELCIAACGWPHCARAAVGSHVSQRLVTQVLNIRHLQCIWGHSHSVLHSAHFKRGCAHATAAAWCMDQLQAASSSPTRRQPNVVPHAPCHATIPAPPAWLVLVSLPGASGAGVHSLLHSSPVLVTRPSTACASPMC